MYPSPDPRIFCLLESTRAHPKLSAGLAPVGLLSAAEQARLDGLKVPKRRRDWLLGRWTAKRLLQSYLSDTQGLNLPPDVIEILAAEDGAPYVQVGEPLSLSLSISHSGSESFCAVCALDLGAVGADVEQVEPREPSFVRTFFTPGENRVVDAALPTERDALVTALWSVKEAVLKTLRLGLRADTRQVEIRLSSLSSEWNSVAVTVEPVLLPSASATFTGWCQIQPSHVLSLGLLSFR
jgi:4'-phosphopantetheinyl transferase